MKTISVQTSLSTDLDPALGRATTIELENAPLGQGGFGVAYRAHGIDGRAVPPQVVKLFTSNIPALARHGYETVQEFQRRLRAANAKLLAASGRGLVESFPALQAVPQLSFEGVFEGRVVLGYTANDLTRAGFEEFGRILNDDAKTRAFQALALHAKLRIGAQLVSAFDFLASEIRFIHADMKAEALFVDRAGLRCAIIDCDSGALARDASDMPTTFGTRQDWLAPEIVRQLDTTGNANRVVQVNLLSDVWSITIALHYLLFGCHPLFFLTEISDRSVDAYFQRFQWPDIDPAFAYFRREYAAVYQQYRTILRQNVPSEIVQRFAFTINQGFRNPAARTTYGQWKTILQAANRPSIRRFEADRLLVSDARPVHLSWDVTGAARVELRGVGDVTGRTSINVKIRRDTTFELIVRPDAGAPITKKITVTVDKRPPVVHAFASNTSLLTGPTPARLSWRVSGAARVEIDHGIGDVSDRSSIDVLPRKNTRLTLTATSAFGVTATASVDLRVSAEPPRIVVFRSESPYLTNGEPAQLTWQVSPDAEKVVLHGVGDVSATGSIAIPQRQDAEYVLTATSYFGQSASARVQVRVSNAPPLIHDFRVSSSFVREGMDVTLAWQVTGAAQIQIYPAIGAAPASGQRTLRLAYDQQFTLRAESRYGVTVTKTVGVKVMKTTRLTDRATGRESRPTVVRQQTALGNGTRTTRRAVRQRATTETQRAVTTLRDDERAPFK